MLVLKKADGEVLNIRAILIELDDGSIIEGQTVALVQKADEAAKALAAAEQATVVVEATPDVPVAATVAKPKKKRNRKPADATTVAVAPPPTQQFAVSDWTFQVPMTECVGVCNYLVRAGRNFRKATCAIYRTGLRPDQSGRWYKLLFVSEDNKFAGSPYGEAFNGNADKISEVQWWNGQPQG